MLQNDMSEAGISPQELRDVFKAAKGRVMQGWTREWAARDAEGYSVPPTSPEATCWCALGAVSVAMDDAGLDMTLIEDTLSAIYRKALSTTRFVTVASFNDSLSTTTDDVLAFFDRVIDLIKDD